MVDRLSTQVGSWLPSPLSTALAVALLVACGSSKKSALTDTPADGSSGSNGSGGSEGGNAGDGARDDGGSTGGPFGSAGEGGAVEPPPCSPIPAGLVRLSKLQVKTSLAALFGVEAAESITAAFEIDSAERQSLPPLRSPGEGTFITDTLFLSLDGMAQAAGAYVRDQLDLVTGCGSDPTDECARGFLEEFSERAFRRPPEAVELANLLQVYDEARSDDIGASVAEAIQHGVYAVLESPLFVYRSELGAPDAASGTVTLTPHELASEVSFFLTGAPPDAELLALAGDAALSTPEALAGQVDRLLATELARSRFAAAAFSALRLPGVEELVIDSTLFPAWSASLRQALAGEARRFLAGHWFALPLPELLTTRTAWIDAELAGLYGVAFPPDGAMLDADGFAPVTLGPERSGLLTLGAALARGSRPDGSSVVGRGLWVNAVLTCQPTPPPPDDLPPSDPPPLAATEQEKAALRAADPLCASCHALIDPYGLVLEAFDAIGAYRGVEASGVPIGPVTLPAAVGGATVSDAAELGAVLAAGDGFAACLARAFLEDALSMTAEPLPTDGCEVTGVVSTFRAGSDPSFGGLARAIALSPALRARTRNP